ncbi:hypothetical protein KGF54_003859 [Candida jiufengensis]|uniref:uncharacterized protein n=1 Tax=Candida jiufengensis TaxID=497108 RepID=UPI00222407B7|nr:uncharacterized protein KGF54_003859 [Candida jiufengensis]KAI5950785.1 hypothetical protein KGF54_003859 [Candida jiufengensis]
MSITNILKLPIEIIQRIIDLIDDRDTLLGLANLLGSRDKIYKRLFPKLTIFHKQPATVHGNFISFYPISKFLNFLDDYNNYVPNEILTNVDTLYEMFDIKHINFENTKINLIIHPHHTIEDLRFSFINFKIISIILKPFFDYQLTGKLYDTSKVYFAQLDDEEFQSLTFPNTLEKFEIFYKNKFLKNLPHSLRELNLRNIDYLNSTKFPLSLESLCLINCKISGVILDLSYLSQLKKFKSDGRVRINNDFSSGELKLPSSIESICLSSSYIWCLNDLSDYENLKILKLMRCKNSILLFNMTLPPHLENLQIEFICEESVNLDNSDYGETTNLNNVTLINQPEAGSLYEINGENVFPSTLKVLKLTDMDSIFLDFQLNLPNLEELEFAFSPFTNPHSLINENLVNLKKLTVTSFGSTMESVKFPRNLEYLNLRNNCITSLIEFNLNNLNKLKHLIVRENQITSITEQIAPNLKILDISDNPIQKLCHQENLKQLVVTTSKMDDICINNLETFELEFEDDDHDSIESDSEVECEEYVSSIYNYNFQSCFYLKELILRLNIGSISNLTFPDTLEILDVTCMFDNDDFQNLYNISNCHNLKTFKLKSCTIKSFSFNDLPKKLENFAIIDSRLKTIHGSLKNSKNLKILNLKSNKIDNDGLEYCYFSSPKLELIDLDGNYIDNIGCIRIRSCPRLIELNLVMNSEVDLYITDEDVAKLKSNCPRLSIIRTLVEE